MSGLRVTGYALATPADLPAPAHRRVPLPAAGAHPRRARLPGLAAALGRAALGADAAPPGAAVLLGTALGSLTETEAFCVHMIEADEGTPKPRAFSASVHNAAAAQLAQAVGARGETRTLVHGPLGPLQALWLAARRRAALTLAGGLDEVIPRVNAAWGACGVPAAPPAEGGALLCLAPAAEAPLATLEHVTFGRSTAPAQWVAERLAGPLDLLLTPTARWELPAGQLPSAPARSYGEWGGGLAAGPAVASAAAVALLAGELEPAWAELTARPARVGVAATTRWGEVGLAVWSRS